MAIAKLFFTFLFLFILGVKVNAQESNDIKAFALDEMKSDTSFVAFRSQLLLAIINRDTLTLKTFLHDTIYGGYADMERNPDEFVKTYCIDRTYNDSLKAGSQWDYWYKILNLGSQKYGEDSIYSVPNLVTGNEKNGKQIPFGYQTWFTMLKSENAVYSWPSFSSKRIDTIGVQTFPRLCSIDMDLGENSNWAYFQAKYLLEKMVENKHLKGEGFYPLFVSEQSLCGLRLIHNTREQSVWTAVLMKGEKKIGFVPMQNTTADLWNTLEFRKIRGRWKIIGFGGPAGC